MITVVAKPCPFCGRANVSPHYSPGWGRVMCLYCGATGPEVSAEEQEEGYTSAEGEDWFNEALERWNNRQVHDTQF